MNKIAKTILIIVLCLAVVGGIFGVVAWTQSDKFDQKDLSFLGKYDVGGLDSNGNYMSTNASIYTKKPIECQGLNCNLVFDSTISYQLYFYDQNNEFVHTTGKLTGTFTEDGVPFFAKYVRIVITPNDDDKVTSMEVVKYAKQLKVSANREQGFKNYTENLVKVGTLDKAVNQNTGELVDLADKSNFVSEYIDVAPYDEAMMFRVGKFTDISNSAFYMYDANKNYVGYAQIGENASVIFTASDGTNYYSVSLDKIIFADGNQGKEFKYILVSCSTANQIEVYCR